MDTLFGFILLALSLYGAKNLIDRIIGVLLYRQKRKNINSDIVSK